jgi:enoyl-CoA hydratase
VHGYCLGGGTVYAYLTDLTVAAEDAYFQMPLPQGFGLPGAQTLMEPWVLMNWKKAYQYLYLGQTLSAEEAKEWGLINEVVTPDHLESRVEEVAATIAQMPLSTIMAVKAGVRRAWETMGMRVHLQSTADFTTIASAATDVREFMAQRGGRLPRQVAKDGATVEGDRPAE